MWAIFIGVGIACIVGFVGFIIVRDRYRVAKGHAHVDTINQRLLSAGDRADSVSSFGPAIVGERQSFERRITIDSVNNLHI